MEACRTNGSCEQEEVKWRRKDGTTIWVSLTSHAVKNRNGEILYFEGFVQNVTERKMSEEAIKSSLKEKEVLLKEMHHRVKNNLQVISSLLKLQSEASSDPSVIELFKISQQRVHSIALIHQQLFKSSDLSSISFGNYVKHLSHHLYSTYGINPDNIKLSLDIANINIEIETAIPCGLIINEALSNSLKHAFPDGRKGNIGIKMLIDSDNTNNLSISDNGIGFPKGMDYKKTKSFGLQLIKTIAEQLDSLIEIDNKEGTQFLVKFKPLPYKRRI